MTCVAVFLSAVFVYFNVDRNWLKRTYIYLLVLFDQKFFLITCMQNLNNKL